MWFYVMYHIASSNVENLAGVTVVANLPYLVSDTSFTSSNMTIWGQKLAIPHGGLYNSELRAHLGAGAPGRY